jgi:stress-induced morphogen
MTLDEIKQKVLDGLPGAQVDVLDMTGTGDHIRVEVIAPQFEGRSLVQQHQMINELLRAHLADGSIHALSIQTAVPADGITAPAKD